MYYASSYFASTLFTEPTGNVAPRIAGERYEGGKLIDVLKTSMAALDCATQGFPVPLTRYRSAKIIENFLLFFTILHNPISEGTSKIAPRSSGKKFEGWELVLIARNQDVTLSHSLQGYPAPFTR